MVENWTFRNMGSLNASGKTSSTSPDASFYVYAEYDISMIGNQRAHNRGKEKEVTSLLKASKKLKPECPVISHMKRF